MHGCGELRNGLLQKIAKGCEAADIPLDDEAPDFIVATSGLPPLSVFRMADNMTQIGQGPQAHEEEEPEAAGLVEALTRAVIDKNTAAETQEEGESE